mgnify:CR=1 FL=1
MSSLFLLAALVGIAALMAWSVMIERQEVKARSSALFGIRSIEDYRQRYGDQLPF